MDHATGFSGYERYPASQRNDRSSERSEANQFKITRDDVNFANKLVSKFESNSKDIPVAGRQEKTVFPPSSDRKINKIHYPPKLSSESPDRNMGNKNGPSDVGISEDKPDLVKIRMIRDNLSKLHGCSIEESVISKMINDQSIDSKEVGEAAAGSRTGEGVLALIYMIWSTSNDSCQPTEENKKSNSYAFREGVSSNPGSDEEFVSASDSVNDSYENKKFPSVLLFGSGGLEETVTFDKTEQQEETQDQLLAKHTPYFLIDAENSYDIKEQLVEDKLINSDEEFDYIVELLRIRYGVTVWKGFSEEYKKLAQLNGMLNGLRENVRCTDIDLFSHETLLGIYCSGIFDFYSDDIREAQTWDQAETVIRNVHKDVQAMAQQFDKNMPSGEGLNLRDFPLKNFGNTCWFNSSLNFMLDCFSQQTIEALELKEYTDSAAETLPLKTALRDTLVSIWKIRKHQREHQRFFSVLGYQKQLMRCLHQMGQQDPVKYGALAEIFDRELPGAQRDASGFLVGFMDALELNDDPSFSIQSQAYVTTTVKDDRGHSHKSSRPAGKQEGFQPMNLPIARNPGWLEMAAMAIKPEALNRLIHAGMMEAKAIELRSCFYLLGKAVCPERDKKTDEGVVRQRGNKLDNCLLQQLNDVVRPDAIVINQQRILQQKCLLSDGRVIPQGTQLPEPGNKTELFPYVHSQGEVTSGTVVKADSGELLIMYDLGGGEQYVRGVAEVDSEGSLASPFLTKPTLIAGSFKPFPDRTLVKKSRILAYDGTCFGSHDTEGKPVIIEPVLTELLGIKERENMNGEQKIKYATALLRMLGVREEEIDQEQLERLSAPVTFKDCLDRFHQEEAGNYSWTRKDIETYCLNPASQFTVFRRGRTEFKCLGTRHQALIANVSQLSRFSISLPMFESGPGCERKRAQDATNAFLSGACPRISLPVIDSASEASVEVQGRLRSLVCHKGSATSGHYIHLSLAGDGTVAVVHDDDVSVGWSEYLENRELMVNQSLEDFIRDSGFTPYVALYERTFPERSPEGQAC